VTEPLRITFATRDGALAAAYQSILAQEPDVEVTIETRGLEALAWSAGATPHVVVAAGLTSDVLEAFARLRALPRFDRCRMVLARPALAPEEGALEASQGVRAGRGRRARAHARRGAPHVRAAHGGARARRPHAQRLP
jgi:hypothetical protein